MPGQGGMAELGTLERWCWLEGVGGSVRVDHS